ncbi:DUF3369 domain-containing protein [Pseudothauera hydrothermalis]|uniref:DUF3369 domain-containing protein n=1 Tax=Pseudothauera hydrothermalis TaxID=2184083 RepID=UPI001F3D94C1|nr:DUF3369 domain-containing protein [Pseudothauera hydrothermalis]
MTDEFLFSEELPADHLAQPQSVWRVLVVDDDPDVHASTRFALGGVSVVGRPVALLHVHTAAEALAVLARERDIAVMLLDVVMEDEHAGLRLVDKVRAMPEHQNLRIILRTGQPGYAPETETIARYDINDYKTKSELTRAKLFASLTAAVRSYEQLQRIEGGRRGLAQILQASHQLACQDGLDAFAAGVITQLASFMGTSPDGGGLRPQGRRPCRRPAELSDFGRCRPLQRVDAWPAGGIGRRSGGEPIAPVSG